MDFWYQSGDLKTHNVRMLCKPRLAQEEGNTKKLKMSRCSAIQIVVWDPADDSDFSSIDDFYVCQ